MSFGRILVSEKIRAFAKVGDFVGNTSSTGWDQSSKWDPVQDIIVMGNRFKYHNRFIIRIDKTD
jgi:hypothetical protein